VAIDLGEGEQTPESLVTVKAYLVVDEEIENRRRSVEESLWHLRYIWPVIPEPVFASISDQDWTGAGRKTIPVLHLGKHVVIKPSWRDYTPQPDDVVLELDPGMAFGTGLHPTTSCACRRGGFNDAADARVWIWNWHGHFGIGAAKVGAAEVVAVDTDINAVTIVRRNASRERWWRT
jgi:ribosomal protein L11 methyltransferase